MRPTKKDPSESPIAAVLFGKTRRRLLGWLYMHPEEAFFVRQLVRITGGSPGSVPVELGLLTSAGLLKRTVKGREVFYQANRRSPVFRELRNIVRKTINPIPGK